MISSKIFFSFTNFRIYEFFSTNIIPKFRISKKNTISIKTDANGKKSEFIIETT